MKGGQKSTGTIYRDVRDKYHQEVFIHHSNLSILHSLMTSEGTKLLLDKNSLGAEYAAIVYRSEYSSGSDFNLLVFSQKIRDLAAGGMKEATSFLEKRIPCDCLKRMNNDLTNEVKRRICFNCNEETDFYALKECGRCHFAHYCNKGCQVQDWPRHKKTCTIVKSD